MMHRTGPHGNDLIQNVNSASLRNAALDMSFISLAKIYNYFTYMFTCLCLAPNAMKLYEGRRLTLVTIYSQHSAHFWYIAER